MIALLMTLGFILLIAAINGITEAFDEAFRGDWMSFDDKPTDRDNTEYSWGHNIKNYMED